MVALSPAPNGVHPTYAAVATLAAAAAGGGVFAALGLPAGWLSGALVAVAALAILGAEVAVPDALRAATFIVLGISMGTAVKPDTLVSIRAWPVSIALLLVCVVVVMAVVTLYLKRVAKWDSKTAFYASAPGALTSVLALAAQDRADVRRVAFAQAIRLFLLIAALPGTFAALGLASPGTSPSVVPAIGSIGLGNAGELGLMAIAGVAAGLAAERFGVPGGLLFGSMLASALLHGSGLVAAMVPQYVLIPCFVALGASIGTRFLGTDMATLRHFLVASLGAFAVAGGIAAAFAVLAAKLSGEGVAKTILAFAPGGIESMSVLAFVIGLDPAFVAAHQLTRFLSIALFLPIVSRLLYGPASKAD